MEGIVEQWRPVVGWEKFYEVSDQGRVRNLQSGKILSNRPNKKLGYVLYALNAYKRRKMTYGHVLVLEAFVGPRPEGDYQACHINGTKSDNRLSNLRWDTRASNYQDARLHGTNSKGSRHGGSKLSEDQILLIRQDNRLQAQIAEDYGISRTTVSVIKSKKSWEWL